MKRLATIILSCLLALTVTAQVNLKTKYISLAGSATSATINLASDADIVYFSGTRTLSSGYTVNPSGTAVDGKTILILWDGTSLTSNGNPVTVISALLNEKQAESKVIVMCMYRGSTAAWDCRVIWDFKTTDWIGIDDIDTSVVDNQTLELDGTAGIQVKDGGITNAKIVASAGIPITKLSLTKAIDSSHLSLTANIPWYKMLSLTANRVPYIGADGKIAASSATSTELGYLAGVTSAIQTQLNAKTTSGSIVAADINATAAIPYSKLSLKGSLLNADVSSSCSLAMAKLYPLTGSKALYSNASGVITASPVTSTELGYLSGVTSAVQTQLTNARSSQTYTSTSTTPLVLTSAATDQYRITVSTTPIVVTLPAAADIPQYRTISFTRIGTVADSSVTIVPAGSDNLVGVGGPAVASYVLAKETAGGAGVMWVSNGVDTWYYIRRW